MTEELPEPRLWAVKLHDGLLSFSIGPTGVSYLTTLENARYWAGQMGGKVVKLG